jgi:hypothetical protein
MRTPGKRPRLAWLLVKGLLLAAWGLLLPGLPGLRKASDGAIPDSIASPDASDPVARRAVVLERLGVSRWHKEGVRGRGLKVAILDTGFRGYRSHLGKALPERVTVRSFRLDGNLEARDSQHGILCGEVVHTLAPDAEILFANWEPDRADQFLDAVRWARREGARVLSCSVITPAWSDGEGHGAVHRELSRILGDGDLLCFACAGNTAQRHWAGTFHDGGDGWHEWEPGQKENAVQPWGSERVSVELCTRPGAAYELIVRDRSSGREVGRGRTPESGDPCCATVRFDPEPGHDYAVGVRLPRGKPADFHLVVLGGGLRYSTSHGSIPFPADGPEVIAVGAVDEDGHRLAYSSCGPNSSRPKPDLVAPVPFPSSWRAHPFAGTSAAAPQAAGLAALVWSRHPKWKAARVWETLRAAAIDLGPPGHDNETGYGRVHLPLVNGEW